MLPLYDISRQIRRFKIGRKERVEVAVPFSIFEKSIGFSV